MVCVGWVTQCMPVSRGSAWSKCTAVCCDYDGCMHARSILCAGFMCGKEDSLQGGGVGYPLIGYGESLSLIRLILPNRQTGAAPSICSSIARARASATPRSNCPLFTEDISTLRLSPDCAISYIASVRPQLRRVSSPLNPPRRPTDLTSAISTSTDRCSSAPRRDAPTPSLVVPPGSSVVTSVGCHRAHHRRR